MLFSSMVRLGIRFNVWLLSGYAHVLNLYYFPLLLSLSPQNSVGRVGLDEIGVP